MTRDQRFVLTIAIVASFVAFLDGSVINVALPAISSELGGGLSTQQWVVDAYLITLGSLKPRPLDDTRSVVGEGEVTSKS